MTTYAELLSNCQQWTEDDSAEYLAAFPEIVARSEDRIFLDVPDLQHHRAVETGNFTSSNRLLSLTTTNLRKIQSLQVTSSSAEVFLQRREISYIDAYTPSSTTTGVPKYYARFSPTQIAVAPSPSSAYAYTLRYWAIPARLTSSNTTTTLGITYPDLLQKACLYESGLFLQQEEETIFPMWKADYESAAAKVVAEVQRSYAEDNLTGA